LSDRSPRKGLGRCALRRLPMCGVADRRELFGRPDDEAQRAGPEPAACVRCFGPAALRRPCNLRLWRRGWRHRCRKHCSNCARRSKDKRHFDHRTSVRSFRVCMTEVAARVPAPLAHALKGRGAERAHRHRGMTPDQAQNALVTGERSTSRPGTSPTSGRTAMRSASSRSATS